MHSKDFLPTSTDEPNSDGEIVIHEESHYNLKGAQNREGSVRKFGTTCEKTSSTKGARNNALSSMLQIECRRKPLGQ